MKLKCFSLFLSLLTVMLFVMTEPVGVFAQEENRVPDIDNRTKSLTVYFYIQKNGVDTPIEGAEIGIYKIADLQTEGGSAYYTVSEQYDSLRKTKDDRDVTFEGISVTESVELAKNFAALAKSPDATAFTDNRGTCSFTDMEQGMYLVCELSADGEAAQYELFAPYLISVPLFAAETGIDDWQYDVLSEPKTKIVVEVSEPSETSEPSDTGIHTSDPSETSIDLERSEPESSTPDIPSTPGTVSTPPESSQDTSTVITGDSSWIFGIFGLWCVSALLVVIANQKKKKGADENE